MKRNLFRISQHLIIQSFLLFSIGLLPGKLLAQQTKPVDEAAYHTAIQTADALFKSKNYDEALRNYKKAFLLNPAQPYPMQQIDKISQVLSTDEKLRNTLFENAILQGETLFKSKNYPGAKREFQKALDIDPSAQYAKDRLKAIAKVYTDPEDEANFKSAMLSAEASIQKNEFDKAINWYQVAQTIKPDDDEPYLRMVETKTKKETYIKKKIQYDLLITSADKFSGSAKYKDALSQYQKALEIFPNEPYPKQKADELTKILAGQKDLQDRLDEIIGIADQFYVSRDFANAKLKYEEALKVKPDARYPKEMLSKIQNIDAQKMSDKERYDALIAAADKLFNAGDFTGALTAYQSVLKQYSDDTYSKGKIAEIEKLFANQAKAEENYANALKTGDAAFAAKKWEEALTAFGMAQKLKPAEKYPQDKIKEINGILADLKGKDDSYLALIASGDQKFAAAQYSEAISDYQNALKIKPSEKYPQDQITESNKLLAGLKSKDEQFAAAVKDGDKFFAANKLSDALTSFEKASSLKPAEKYPQDKIAEINKMLAAVQSENELYQAKITQGDAFFNQQKLNEALEQYRTASTMRPNEKYPQAQMDKINKLLADQKALDQKYEQLIASADQSFSNKQWQDALTSYQDASKLKPGESYPKTRIGEISALLADAKTREENYSKFIAQGNAAFTAQNWTDALTAFESANQLKPAEKLPQDKIKEINGILADLKAKDADYLNLVASGDQKLAASRHAEALSDYQNASKIKPSEKYPQEKIAEINKLLADQKSRDEQFAAAIKDGEKFFAANKLSDALTSFEKASSLKPAEKYPQDKITEINQKLAAMQSESEAYQAKITQGDAFFNQQKLNEALEQYRTASTMRPNEKYPQAQIAKIDKLLADQKALDQRYEQLIASADQSFSNKQLQDALTSYQDASKLKPAESYPKTKIEEISSLLADAKTREENYSKFIAQGNAAFTAKNWNDALTAFESASQVKPAEKLPQDKIKEINGILADLKAKDDNYLALVASADQKLAASQHAEALSDYQNASKIKPAEKYPQDKIAEINKLLADQKSRDEQFAAAIKDGDRLFAATKWQDALASFEKASSLKPAEKYPQDKITEINQKLAAIQSENEAYQAKITQGDAFFSQQKLNEALEQYRTASTMRPNEKYPPAQMDKINKLLADQKATDQKYNKLISDGDKALQGKQWQIALAAYQDASGVKPAEEYPKTKIAEITATLADLKAQEENFAKAMTQGDASYAKKELQTALSSYQAALQIKPNDATAKSKEAKVAAEIKALDEQYAKALADGDKKLAAKDYLAAINSYQTAGDLKPAETQPKTKIAEVQGILAREKDELDRLYNGFISDGDKQFASQSYDAAKSAFTKASGIKPAEQYPKDKLAEIAKINAERDRALKAEYDKAVAIADDLYKKKILDEALEAYDKAAAIKPDETYAADMAKKIRQYIADHAIQDVTNQQLTIKSGDERKFTLTPIEMRMRKNNFIVIRAKSGSTVPKVFLNYGKDGQKNGGIVLRAISNEKQSDYMINMAGQDRWYREDNNWISIYVEGGDVEITRIQVLAGD